MGSVRIPLADLDRHACIVCAVKKSLRNSQRQPFNRRGKFITVRNFIRTATKKIRNNSVAELQLPCAAQIHNASQRNSRAENLGARSEPECQMTSGRVTQRNNAIQIQIETRSD